jgi:hypothetical protein
MCMSVVEGRGKCNLFIVFALLLRRGILKANPDSIASISIWHMRRCAFTASRHVDAVVDLPRYQRILSVHRPSDLDASRFAL